MGQLCLQLLTSYVVSSSASTTAQHVAARDQQPTAEPSKRTVSGRSDTMTRPSVPRSRSRVQRRFSGSTAPSSHSPSSERGAHSHRDKDEAKTPPIGIIGVCALDVKARSKPSRNILNRLIGKGEFEVVVFGDKTILDEEIENWPVCDFLISFYSDGFPLEKAIAYVKARKPFCVNDVPMQKILWDRRICLRILDKIEVPSPRRVEVNRDGGPSVLTADLARHLRETTGVILEGPEDGTGGTMTPPRTVELMDDGDTLYVDGKIIRKPFVEKPTSGEDHNICIYFPKDSKEGWGARKLFRKIGNKSSEWVDGLTVPRAITEPNSSYIYEEFMFVDNAEDVKAYTVGPKFCHAETRKSPVVDGLVRRNTHGKEIRYITPLTKEEQGMAARIAVSFGQRVCGFDLLRVNGKSYVIDVNGWSFVKDNEEYYIRCADILREMFIAEKQRKEGSMAGDITPTTPEPDGNGSVRSQAEKYHQSTLRSILAKTPSMQKLSNNLHHGRKSVHGAASPDLVAMTNPLSSPPSVERSHSGSVVTGLPSPVNTQFTTPNSAGSTTAASVVAGQITAEPESILPPPPPTHAWKLKGMVSVIRHADRTPKQKYKFTFHTKPFIELLKGHQEEVLITGETALQTVMRAVDQAMEEGVEDRAKLKTLGNVLAKKASLPGTKVQIKPMFRKRKSGDFSSKGVPHIGDIPVDLDKALPAKEKKEKKEKKAKEETAQEDAARSPKRADSLTGVTLSRITAAEDNLVLDKLQLIVKWGGEPTHSARYQAQELGENMRNDLLLMNKEILDEVHVFSSSERRVTTSTQIWTAAFLDAEELPSDYITVRKDLLDDSNAAKDEMDKVKKKLKLLLREGQAPPPQFAWPENLPEPSVIMRDVVELMKFHRRVMRHNYNKLFGNASGSLDTSGGKTPSPSSSSSAMHQANATTSIQARWCCGEDAELFRERWEKLFAEFCDVEKVDPSKISELYDTMKFDALHNRQFLEWVFTPSKSILEEEETAMKMADDKQSDYEEGRPSMDLGARQERKGYAPSEKSEKSSSSRLFARRRSMLNYAKAADEATAHENYFRLFTGSSQTKAKVDHRLEKLRQLYKLAKVLFDFIGPQEYGMSEHEKLEIGLLTSLPLLKEIVQDLEEMQASDVAKSFFYFTKESHIYTLLNCILEGGIETKIKRADIPELDYLSQICFELYESETPPRKSLDENGNEQEDEEGSTFNYSIRITISPGCHTYDPLDVQLDSKHCIGCAPRRSLTPHADWKVVIETLRAKFHQ
jgi:inositol hexakisphosphate/diphosphoinositol-pentakisphosphate kinase